MRLQPMRGSDVRQLNERIVLNLFYDHECVSQSDIVSITGLKPSTVLRIFSNLESSGEIIMIDPETDKTKRSVVGRHPVYYRINPSAHYAVGMTFSKDTIEMVALDFALNIVHSAKEPFTLSQDKLAGDIAAFLQRELLLAAIPSHKLLGIGVGCPGNVDPDRGIMLSVSADPSIHDFPLKSRLEELLHARVFLQGANLLAAQYYNRYGDIEDRDKILYLSIGSAVTASFYARSVSGMLGGVPSLPVGWMLLQRPDSILNMQDVRTLNSICSEESILSFLHAKDICTMAQLDQALLDDSHFIKEYMQNMVDALSYCISNLSMLFNPQLIILASRSKQLSVLLSEEVSHTLNQRYYWPFDKEPSIMGKTHNFRRISRSAVDLVLDNEFAADLGWKRPKVLNQPQQQEGWQRHIID